MHIHLVNFLRRNKLLFYYQFGFRNGYSVNQDLTSSKELIRKALDEDKFASGLFIDPQKALDIVAKLYQYDCNWTRTQNHLVLKRTLNHSAKWLSVRLRTKWFWVRVQLQSLHLQISRLLRARSTLTFRQL